MNTQEIVLAARAALRLLRQDRATVVDCNTTRGGELDPLAQYDVAKYDRVIARLEKAMGKERAK